MTNRRSRVSLWLALLGSCLAGLLTVTQTRINGGFSLEIGNSFLVGAISFCSGFLVLCCFLLLTKRSREGLSRIRQEVRAGRLPIWTLTGGVFGALFVFAQGFSSPLIGLAMFTIGVIAGQVVGGLVMDRMGLGPGGQILATIPRVAGATLAVLAVAISLVSDVLNRSDEAFEWWHLLLACVIGAGSSFQTAVNGLVRAAGRDVVTAVFLNFAIGSVVIVGVAIGSVLIQGWPKEWPVEPGYYIGGFVGVIFIGLNAGLVRISGVLLLGMGNVAGQLIGSVLYEIFLPFAGGLTIWLLLGSFTAFLAVMVSALPSRAPTD